MASTVLNKGESEAVTTTNASFFFVSSPSHLNSSVTSEESFIRKLNLQYRLNNKVNTNDALISLKEQFPTCLEKTQTKSNVSIETMETNINATRIDSHYENQQDSAMDQVMNDAYEPNKETTCQDMELVNKTQDNEYKVNEMPLHFLPQETLRKRSSRSQNGIYKRIHTMPSKYSRRYKDKTYTKVTLPSSRVTNGHDNSDQDVSKDLRFELLPLPTVVKSSPLPCETKVSCYDMFDLSEKNTCSTLKKSSFQTFPICEVIRLVAEALEVPLHHVEELFNETSPLTLNSPLSFPILSENKSSSIADKQTFQQDFENLDTHSSAPDIVCKQHATFLSSLPSHPNFLKNEYLNATKTIPQATPISTNVPYTSSTETFLTNSYVSPLPSYTLCNKKDKLNNFLLSNTRSMKGVSFDRSKRNWEASWLDAQTGKRVKKCFSEGRWGSSARDMAILARRKAEQSGIISTRQQFQNSSNLLPETETPTSLSPRITLGKPTTFPLDHTSTTQDDLLQQIASRVTKNILLQNKKNTI